MSKYHRQEQGQGAPIGDAVGAKVVQADGDSQEKQQSHRPHHIDFQFRV